MRLLVASGNGKKLAELRGLLSAPASGAPGLEILAPADVGGLPEVVEDQPDFAGNALRKARSGALASGLPCLADDSGLCVDALGGAPGVRSARFAGEGAGDAANNRLLLERLAAVDDAGRGAHFVCALSLCAADGTELARFRGECPGRILRAPRGSAGFGYDPLFEYTGPEPDCRGRSFAELDAAQKGRVGHRGRALWALLAARPQWLPRMS
jgi:XTP/dITP diphosphohydrolase